MNFDLGLEHFYITSEMAWNITCAILYEAALCSHDWEAQVFINSENAEDALCIL